MKNKTLIIAEAGVNHNGSVQLAKELIDVAVSAGADVIKFQTFKSKNIVTESAQQAEYQTENIGKKESQLTMLQRLELGYDEHFILLDYCRKKGIEFLSTAFDSESLDFLTNSLGQTTLKIPSGEITNAPFLLEHARKNLKIIMSTGMATLGEIEYALSVLAFGLTNSIGVPSNSAFLEAYSSDSGQRALAEKVVILHCTTEYPAKYREINLKVINSLKSSFNLPVGYSDHSKGIEVSLAAVALGAVVIEKHFTLNCSMEGPDHKASLEPKYLKSMVSGIRNIERALGVSVKTPQESESLNKVAARKSLVAARDIQKGEVFSETNLAIMRPGNGMSPSKYWSILNKNAMFSYRRGELINE